MREGDGRYAKMLPNAEMPGCLVLRRADRCRRCRHDARACALPFLSASGRESKRDTERERELKCVSVFVLWLPDGARACVSWAKNRVIEFS